MDRVEELTGRPIGDVSASIDASPALHASCPRPGKATGLTNEASKALSSILRIAGHGLTATNSLVRLLLLVATLQNGDEACSKACSIIHVVTATGLAAILCVEISKEWKQAAYICERSYISSAEAQDGQGHAQGPTARAAAFTSHK